MKSERTKILLAIIASLLVHLLIAAFLAIWESLPLHQAISAAGVEPEPTPEPIEITVQSLLAKVQPVAATPTLIISDGLAESEEAPENAAFQSDKNMKAASGAPATGDAPLPSQEGTDRTDVLAFETKRYTPHLPGIAPSAPAPESQPAVTPAPKAIPTPEATPTPKPVPVATPTPQPIQRAATPIPAPSAEPRPTLISSEATHTIARLSPPRPDQVADPIYAPTPISRDSPMPTPRTMAKPTPLPLHTPAPAMAPEPAIPQPRTNPSKYQPTTEKTRVEGSISNRGPAGVDARATPLGRYQKAVHDAVGSRWHYHVEARSDLIGVGRARIKFYIRPDGRVEDAELVSNTSTATFGSISLQSVVEAKIPPIPEEISYMLENGRMELTFNFSYY
jgi:hypothetical protein